jgi:signal peptidase
MDGGPASARSRLVTALLLVAGLSVLVLGLGARMADLRFQTVLSGSMRPTISPGDVAVTQPVSVADLRTGDVIAFVPPGSTRPVLHRITSVTNGVITTRGDANPVDDPWHVVYRLVAVVPLLGWLSNVKVPALVLAALLFGTWLVRAVGKEVGTRTFRRSSRPA